MVMTDKFWGIDADNMDESETMSLADEQGRSLLCYVENSIKLASQEYVLLLPIDSPIEIFAWTEDDEDDEEEMLVDIPDEDIDSVFPSARAVLAEQDLILQRSAITLTASGDLPDVQEEDIISLDIEDPSGKPNVEQFQQLASFFHDDQEYVVCTPMDPLLFFARLNEKREPQLLSPEEFQKLLELDEFKEIQSRLEEEYMDDDEEDSLN
jgi:Protein of unknown function (DUF3727)/Protein of unknown function (DUF1292)